MSVPLQLQIEKTPNEEVSIETVLTRGVDTLMPENGLLEILSGDPIRMYLGIDPTSPDLHIGHLVPLRKLRELQILGHQVILLFGTFTGMIGDPSDKSAARVRLTEEQIEVNVATYKEQAGKILDLSPNANNPVEVVYNHEWLGKLSFKDVIDLASNFTINNFIGRETYKKRLEAGTPLYVHEVLYPIMQGYDSVALDVSLEVGGKDQIPNMLAGSKLISVYNRHEKWVMGMKLIEDPSGAKMGKTSGNVVNIMETPEVIYEAIMTWPDNTIPLGLEVLTFVPMKIVNAVKKELARVAAHKSDTNPMVLKEALAWRVVSELNGPEDANYAREVFNLVKRKKQLPPHIKEVSVPQGCSILNALTLSALSADSGEAQSRLSQDAVFVDQKLVRKDAPLPTGEHIIEIGKRSIKNVRRIIVS